jgi:hypothetical protein
MTEMPFERLDGRERGNRTREIHRAILLGIATALAGVGLEGVSLRLWRLFDQRLAD